LPRLDPVLAPPMVLSIGIPNVIWIIKIVLGEMAKIKFSK
jgi:hypothetical protein